MKPIRNVPEIVPVVLGQLARMYVAHEIPKEFFKQKIRRLCVEELSPRGLTVLVRELPDARIRFIIKDTATHSFIHMMECPYRSTQTGVTAEQAEV
ncbi:MAG TPA: hypothetical protein VGH55_01445 [Chthoniobacterales bacterium]|jgi:hypothetical protein